MKGTSSTVIQSRRKNGFSLPLGKYQLLVWLQVVVSMILFFTLCIPFIPNQIEKNSYISIYLFIFLVGFMTFLRTSLIDPAHDRVYSDDADFSMPPSTKVWCNHCNIYKYDGTSHCSRCGKCIEKFDHHCIYLNTCVGKKNYVSFFILIILCTIWMGFQVYVIILNLINVSEPETVLLITNSNLNPHAYMLLLGITGLIPLAGFFLILSLVLFHIYILRHGLTTQKFLKIRREKNEEKKRRKEEMTPNMIQVQVKSG